MDEVKQKECLQKNEELDATTSKQQELEERVEQLRLIDDIFFHKSMEEKEGQEVCEEMLRVILDDQNLTVLTVEVQKDLKNLQGRSVRLDVLCRLGNGKLCNIEVQKSDNDQHFKRVRYNEACITSNYMMPRKYFKDVPDVIMIYISNFKLFDDNRTIHHCYTVCEENGVKVDNGLTEIYVTTEGADDKSLIKQLMDCFMLTKVDNPNFPKLSQRVKHLKSRNGGLSQMCQIVEEYAQKLFEQREKELTMELTKDTIRKLFEKGFDFEQIADVLERIPRETVLALYEEIRDGKES